MDNEIYDVFLIEEYKTNDVTKNRYIPIGTGFGHKSGKGINVRIKAGLSISGEFSLFPRKEKKESSNIEKLTLDN